MAFQKPKKQPQFQDLIGILAQTKKSDNPLYQTVEEIINRLTQFQQVTLAEIASINDSINNVLSEITQITEVTNIINPPMPYFPDGGSSGDGEGEMGPPGPRGPQGPPGPTGPIGVGGVAMPLWIDPEFDYIEPFPQTNVNNYSQQNVNGSWKFTQGRTDFDAPDVGLYFRNSVGALDEKIWRYFLNGQSFFIQATNDIISTASTAMVLRRVAALATAVEVNAQLLLLNAATPIFRLSDSGGGADVKNWRWLISGGTLFLQTVNDADSVAANAYTVGRTGTVVQDHAFYTNGLVRTSLDVNGLLNHVYGLALSGEGTGSIGADQTAWNPTGLGTTFLINFVVTGAFVIRGILAQANGYTVVFRNRTSSANTTSITHEDAAASAANRIQCPNNATLTINPGDSVILRYNTNDLRWQVVGAAL